jgi:hypothetical protein
MGIEHFGVTQARNNQITRTKIGVLLSASKVPHGLMQDILVPCFLMHVVI